MTPNSVDYPFSFFHALADGVCNCFSVTAHSRLARSASLACADG